MEQEGIIATRPGAGTFVANLDSDLSGSVKKKLICDDLERAVVDAFHMQIDKQTLLKWFDEQTGKFNLR
jgi:DNA-binding transcriptional regulator YhcF (GntR family)